MAMRSFHRITLLVTVLVVAFLQGCDRAKGPVLFNDSGDEVQFVISFANHESLNGELPDKRAIWLNRPDLQILSLELFPHDGSSLSFTREDLERMTE